MQLALFAPPPRPSSGRIWSPYQQALFDFALDASAGNALVDAVAGSGKTTTIVEAAHRVEAGPNSLFVAFNKHIVEELSKKLRSSGTPASTLHSVGYAMLREAYGATIGIDAGKYRKILRAWIEEIQRSGDRASCWNGKPAPTNITRNVAPKPLFEREGRWAAQALTKIGLELFEAMRCTLSADLAEHARRFRIDVTLEQIVFFSFLLPRLAEAGAEIKRWGCIDYTDMIFLPATLDAIPANPKRWVFVDEAQDLNVAQRTLVAKLCGPSTRVIFVGDVRQAIYGFSGADTASFRNIRSAFHTSDLALSICYRCPSTHIQLAQEINPAILPADGAKVGTIDEIDSLSLTHHAQDGDLVLCRTNAPLMGACLRVVAMGRRAFVRGREVGAQLARLAEDVQKRMGRKHFLESLAAWVETSLRDIASQDEETREKLIERLHDEKDCLIAIWNSPLHKPKQPNCTDGIVRLCKEIFADKGAEGDAGICFSTIHKAKGLEAPRVFLLPPQPPHPKASGWEFEQEMNLVYVSYTRATEGLYFVDMSRPRWR